MWLKFKWDMFITSFMPLWFSIVFMDTWDFIHRLIEVWDTNNSVFSNLKKCMIDNLILLISVLTILVFVCISILGVNSFLKICSNPRNRPKGKIITAKKANKLSSEFLLAYILPMIAFDFTDLKCLILFVVYLFVLAYLCIRNNNIYTNIWLEFKGYKMYDCDIECRVTNDTEIYADSLIISKYDLTQSINNSIKYWDCDNYIYIAVENEG